MARPAMPKPPPQPPSRQAAQAAPRTPSPASSSAGPIDSLLFQIHIPVLLLSLAGVLHAVSSPAALDSLRLWFPALAPAEQAANASHGLRTGALLPALFPADLGHPLHALHTATRSLFSLQYPVSHTASLNSSTAWINQMYTKGPRDIFLVLLAALTFTSLRALVMAYLLAPLGSRLIPQEALTGLDDLPPTARALAVKRAQRSTQKKILRFAEQGWAVVYYIPSWTLGLWVASRQPYWPLKMEEYWTDYPATTIDGLFKFYYLFQLGFWLHQLLVINLEDKRSDYVQMSSHHLITIALIASSYTLHYHRIGNAILTIMDPCDILLSAAKCLRYMQWQMVCDVMFGLFMVAWFITRHVLFNMMTFSVYRDPQKFIPRVWDAERQIFFSHTLQWTMLGLLLSMQCILLIWFGMIVRVAYRVVTGGEAHDSRSDEDTEEVWDEAQLKSQVKIAVAAKQGDTEQ